MTLNIDALLAQNIHLYLLPTHTLGTQNIEIRQFFVGWEHPPLPPPFSYTDLNKSW